MSVILLDRGCFWDEGFCGDSGGGISGQNYGQEVATVGVGTHVLPRSVTVKGRGEGGCRIKGGLC